MDIVRNLMLLNAKERFHLFMKLTDSKQLQLGEDFKQAFYEKTKISIPKNAFVAIDYHLTWLYAALTIDVENDTSEQEIDFELITRTQEDMDALIAFKKDGTTYIILIEAKLYCSWGSRQLLSKLKRLDKIFDTCKYPIQPILILMSPKESKALLKNISDELSSISRWLQQDQLHWLSLTANEPIKKVSTIKQDSTKWKIVNRQKH